MRSKALVVLGLVLLLTACASKYKAPDLGGLYNDLVQNEDPYRNPVILIPGMLGSRLKDSHTGAVVWGHFGQSSSGNNDTGDVTQIALPIDRGKKLNELRYSVVPDGTLDRVIVKLWGYPLPTISCFSFWRASLATARLETVL